MDGISVSSLMAELGVGTKRCRLSQAHGSSSAFLSHGSSTSEGSPVEYAFAPSPFFSSCPRPQSSAARSVGEEPNSKRVSAGSQEIRQSGSFSAEICFVDDPFTTQQATPNAVPLSSAFRPQAQPPSSDSYRPRAPANVPAVTKYPSLPVPVHGLQRKRLHAFTGC